MPSIGSFSAWIETDDGKLEEFSVDYSPERKTATCWIASQEGKTFKVKVQNSVSQFATSVKVLIDGTKTPRLDLRDTKRCETAKFEGVRMSDNTRKLFQFARYRLLEDEDNVSASLSPHVGEVTVNVHKIELGEWVLRDPKKLSPVTLPALEVSEKAKKGLVHGVELGRTVATHTPSKFTRKVTDIEQVATFVFKYRPLDILRADGLAPRVLPANNNPPTGSHRKERGKASSSVSAREDVIDLTLDDEDESERNGIIDLTVETRIQALEAELSALKKKRKRSSKDEGGPVKKEIKVE